MKTEELKAKAFDLIMAQQRINQELQQIQLALYRAEKADEIGTPATPVTDGNETGDNN